MFDGPAVVAALKDEEVVRKLFERDSNQKYLTVVRE